MQKIRKMCDQNRNSLEIDYNDLVSRENIQVIIVWILYEPSLVIPELNKALRSVVMKIYPEHGNISNEFFVKITNITYLDKLRELRHKDIGHLIQVRGVITKRS